MKHLFIVAHPDDEILGSCGTILNMKKRGDEVVVATASHSSATREDGLKEKSEKTHEIMGVDKSYYFGWVMMQFAQNDRYDMTKQIEDLIIAEQPDYIYTHDNNDIHNDHRVLNGVVMEACKLPMRGWYDKKIKGIYTMEVPSSTDWGYGFVPNAFMEVSENGIEMKSELLRMYDDVLRKVPHPRNYESFLSLARYRGGQCGCLYAEAYRKTFEVIGA